MPVGQMECMVSQVEKNGCIIIPEKFMKKIKIADSDKIQMYIENSSIIIKKCTVNECVVCGNPSQGKTFKGKYICNECLADFRK